jgi:hypothetical protein
MPNIIKKTDHPGRKNISIRPASERLALKLMQKRGRGANFSRLIEDLIHEAADRELSDAAPHLSDET